MSTEKPARFILPPAKVEPSQRWVRVKFGGVILADSKHPLLLINYGRMVLPTYYFSATDVRLDLLGSASKITADKEYFDLKVGDKVAERAAWLYHDPPENLKALKGYYSFEWNTMDGWFEEEEEIFAHARDPYKRVDVMPSSRHVEVIINGLKVADTHRPHLLFETHLPPRFYIPREDVRMDLMQPETTHTICPYKGVASYWSVQSGNTFNKNIAWSYLDPIPQQPALKELICFYNERVDLVVDGDKLDRPLTPFS
ncbi:MAG: hypothetical protein BGO39_12565 [Chloroflexi bacterium 54-19]|nr:MAG: hypothetical protein BGO39_12565 [Chloroflexi bacterium 54-19]